MTAHPNLSVTKSNKSDISVGQEILKEEATALTDLANQLNETFTQAVDTLANIKGRIIVTGMGKSGHIGAKIAATLASTGSPAFFVHPGEASHGDLGMITEEDAVIAISHSGGSKELADILAYCTRYKVPHIALTGKAESTLGQAATVILLNGVKEEACPLNLAPTTSTTATLALGDALAVALMTRKGFQKEDFSRYHPGGKLGAQLLTVSELMAKGDALPTVTPTTSTNDLFAELTSKNFGCVGVVENNQLKGIVTDGDIKRHFTPEIFNQTAADIMTSSPITITAEAFATRAVQIMQDKRITVLFVVNDQNEPLGLIHMHHCLQAGVI